MLTIKEIETIVENFSPLHKVELSELDIILRDQLFKQTNIEAVEEVQKVLNLYNDTKIEWLKKGLENVLLHGEFPVTIKEVTNLNAPSVPTQPIAWPTSVPLVKFEPYCNYNDYKSENLTKVK